IATTAMSWRALSLGPMPGKPNAPTPRGRQTRLSGGARLSPVAAPWPAPRPPEGPGTLQVPGRQGWAARRAPGAKSPARARAVEALAKVPVDAHGMEGAAVVVELGLLLHALVRLRVAKGRQPGLGAAGAAVAHGRCRRVDGAERRGDVAGELDVWLSVLVEAV